MYAKLYPLKCLNSAELQWGLGSLQVLRSCQCSQESQVLKETVSWPCSVPNITKFFLMCQQQVTDFLDDFRKQEGKPVQRSPVSQGDTSETDKAEQPKPSLLRTLQVVQYLEGSYINETFAMILEKMIKHCQDVIFFCK